MKKIDQLVVASSIAFALSIGFSIISISSADFPIEVIGVLLISMTIFVAALVAKDREQATTKTAKSPSDSSSSTINDTHQPLTDSPDNAVPLTEEPAFGSQRLSWINQWKEVKNLGFSTDHKHFFLERRYLDDFSKELISHAKSNVLIANPFIQQCDLSNTLIEASRNGVKVKIITRRPHDEKPEYLERRKKYHSMLIHEGISLFYDDQVHAKIILADSEVAIVSSMNFFASSSAGASWEAGLVTISPSVVESISISFSKALTDIAHTARSIPHDGESRKRPIMNSTILFEKDTGSHAFEEIRRKYPRAYEAWTQEEDNRLIEEFKKGLKVSQIAEMHNRRKGAIRARLAKLGFSI